VPKVKSIDIKDFKRFTDLSIKNLEESVKLIVLVGPNGSGKSSLFEALNYWQSVMKTGAFDKDYHLKVGSTQQISDYSQMASRITVTFYGQPINPSSREVRDLKSVYVRSAYRNEARFIMSQLNSMPDVFQERLGSTTLIDNENKVSDNYKRLVGETISKVYGEENDDTTIRQVREAQLRVIRESMQRVFGDLVLNGVGNPFNGGTFLFEKGVSKQYKYLNLSAGEKAAFDILLDFVIKRDYYNDTVFCIDEPEVHLSSRVQARLLRELYNLLPDNCQLMVATHSIGMMREAFDIHKEEAGSVAFLNFFNVNFDDRVELAPAVVNRKFWKDVFSIAIDDMIDLVSPKDIILCEGRMVGTKGKRNTEFDAKIYRRIFENSYPEVEFVSLGGASEISNGEVILSTIMGQIARGIQITSLIDLDDRSDDEIAELNSKGIRVLRKRDLENYLWDDEILTKLCEVRGKPEAVVDVLSQKQQLIATSVANGNIADDVKQISGQLYVFTKNRLGITQGGNNKEAFCHSTLAPLITSETLVYAELESIIFK